MHSCQNLPGHKSIALVCAPNARSAAASSISSFFSRGELARSKCVYHCATPTTCQPRFRRKWPHVPGVSQRRPWLKSNVILETNLGGQSLGSMNHLHELMRSYMPCLLNEPRQSAGTVPPETSRRQHSLCPPV